MKNSKQNITLATLLSLLVISPVFLRGISVPVMANGSGAIWTTTGTCGDSQKNTNHYLVGDHVYLNGAGFDEASYPWNIGKPGNSGDDVADGVYNVDTSGDFCFDAHTIQPNESGEYQVKFSNVKGDNYRVSGDISPSPSPSSSPSPEPTTTVSPSPTEDVTPTPTCNPGSTKNANGACEHPQPQNGTESNDSGRGGVESTSDNSGQVLGASTIADTGVATTGLFNLFGAIGAYLMSLGLKKKTK